MRVTVIADASFCPDTEVAGYAFWIASGRGKMGGDGIISVPVTNNIASEMIAILNGLKCAMSHSLVIKGDEVLCQTDCQSAIDAFTGARQNITNQEKELVTWFLSFKETRSIQVIFKHVKGHTNIQDPRYIVNNICDRKARKHMRRARAEHIKIHGEKYE